MSSSSLPEPSRVLADFTPAVDEALLARARRLEPIIRQYADSTERERRVARPVLDGMREAGLFRMFTPRSLGGLEVDPISVARVTEELSLIHI